MFCSVMTSPERARSRTQIAEPLLGGRQLALVFARRARVVDRLAGNHRSDVAGMDAADRLAIELVGPRLKVNEHHPLVLRGFLAGRGDGQAAGHVNGDRLGAIDVAAGAHARGRLLGMKIRRRNDGDGVRLGVQRPLVGGQAAEGPLRGNAHPLGHLRGAVGKVVGRGDELVAAVLGEEVGDPTAPRAAAEQGQLDLGVRLRAGDEFGTENGQSQGGCPGKEAAAAAPAGTGLFQGIRFLGHFQVSLLGWRWGRGVRRDMEPS